MPAGTVLWDVVEEHLDDAAHQWEQWSRASGSAELTAAEVAEGVEVRLLASVDALAVAAPEAGARLLEPAMRGNETGAAVAAALALLEIPSGFLATGAPSPTQERTGRRFSGPCRFRPDRASNERWNRS